MIRMGKVYENLMVDLRLTSQKIEERSKRIVMLVTGVSYETSIDLLEKADGHVKTALVMALANVSAEEARQRLTKADGLIRKAISGS